MSSKIQIQEYSEKSFVVRGETMPFKDSLKNLGGKWNSRLSEKHSEEKFGAWLFFNAKRSEVDQWFYKGCNVDVEGSSYKNYTSTDLARIESKLDKILNILMKTNTETDTEYDIDDMENTTTTTNIKKRLL
tara:strand:+ start:3094 stop:3486 length:393 start_codon:yes stop_codon:yes gene_type:complete